MISIVAPLASLVCPGGGQALQGRFAVGLRHAATAILLGSVGVMLGNWAVGCLLALVGCWSCYDAWTWRGCGVAPPPLPGEGPDGSGAMVGRSPAGGVTRPWWVRGLETAVMVALQAAAAVEIAGLFVAVALSVMAFDAPGSGGRLDLWAFVIGMNAVPLLGVFLCFAAWGLRRRGRTWWAVATLAAVVLAGLVVFRILLGPERLW